MKRLTLISLVVATLNVAACAEYDPDGVEPTLDNVQTQVFDVVCATSGCHDAQTAAGDLDLSTSEASYQALIAISAENSIARENGWKRVKPGEPELSFLIRKLDLPGVGEGAAMPMGQFELTDYYRDLITDWIATGAER